MRLFVAIELTEEARQGLAVLIDKFKRLGADVKWVEQENLHISLRFLGDVPEEKVKHLKELLDRISQKHKQFIIGISKIGCFPNAKNPRVIWAGVDKGADMLELIADELNRGLEVLGFSSQERLYHPHITLGRVRTTKNSEPLKDTLKTANFAISHPITIDKVTLFSSTLTPKGPIYTPLHISRFLPFLKK